MAICKTIAVTAPTVPLAVTALNLYEAEPGAVIADVIVNGDGSGTLQITWGSIDTTTHTVSAGQHHLELAMPAGTHEICAEMI